MTAEELVVAHWTEYCLRFGHHPASLIGHSYPGFEKQPMTKTMAVEVAKSLMRYLKPEAAE